MLNTVEIAMQDDSSKSVSNWFVTEGRKKLSSRPWTNKNKPVEGENVFGRGWRILFLSEIIAKESV